ncbi:MAG: hypothetical protein ACRDD1_12155 [Planctomycetia bacterium]
MNLDEAAVVIRPRSRLEVLDLSLLVVRRYWLGLILAAAVGVAPVLALNLSLFSSLPEDSPAVAFYPLLVAAEVPWATAFITLYLGQAMFQETVSVRLVFSSFLRCLPSMLLFQGLFRGVLLGMVVTSPLVPIIFRYGDEVVLLEQSKFNRTGPRLRSFHNNNGGRVVSDALADFFFGAILWLCLNAVLKSAADLWTTAGPLELASATAEEWTLLLSPTVEWHAQVSLWIVLSFLAVARFLGYLDVRIRGEGWDVDLRLAAEARRLAGVDDDRLEPRRKIPASAPGRKGALR